MKENISKEEEPLENQNEPELMVNLKSCVATLVSHSNYIFYILISGNRLFTGSADTTIKV